jgi:hypothetical protein
MMMMIMIIIIIREIQSMWKFKAKVIPVKTGATGTI